MSRDGHSTFSEGPPGCAHDSPAGGTLRCDCGSLLARFVAGEIELKCRRCKRTIMVPLSPAEGARDF